jgi:hypothetical protein
VLPCGTHDETTTQHAIKNSSKNGFLVSLIAVPPLNPADGFLLGWGQTAVGQPSPTKRRDRWLRGTHQSTPLHFNLNLKITRAIWSPNTAKTFSGRMVLAACSGRGLRPVEAEPESFVGHFLPTAYGDSFLGCCFRSHTPDECLAPCAAETETGQGGRRPPPMTAKVAPENNRIAPPREVEATLWRKWGLQDVVEVCFIFDRRSIRGAQPIELPTTALALHSKEMRVRFNSTKIVCSTSVQSALYSRIFDHGLTTWVFPVPNIRRFPSL